MKPYLFFGLKPFNFAQKFVWTVCPCSNICCCLEHGDPHLRGEEVPTGSGAGRRGQRQKVGLCRRLRILKLKSSTVLRFLINVLKRQMLN